MTKTASKKDKSSGDSKVTKKVTKAAKKVVKKVSKTVKKVAAKATSEVDEQEGKTASKKAGVAKGQSQKESAVRSGNVKTAKTPSQAIAPTPEERPAASAQKKLSGEEKKKAESESTKKSNNSEDKAAEKKVAAKARPAGKARTKKDRPEESHDQKVYKEVEEKIIEEMENLSEDFGLEDLRSVMAEVDFFKQDKSDECQEKFCENLQTTMGHCRYHYIKNWKILRKKRTILKEGRLQAFVEELVGKYPIKYIEAIFADLSSEKNFIKVLKELKIESQFGYDDSMSDIDSDEDFAIDTRGYGGARSSNNFEDDEII